MDSVGTSCLHCGGTWTLILWVDYAGFKYISPLVYDTYIEMSILLCLAKSVFSRLVCVRNYITLCREVNRKNKVENNNNLLLVLGCIVVTICVRILLGGLRLIDNSFTQAFWWRNSIYGNGIRNVRSNFILKYQSYG